MTDSDNAKLHIRLDVPYGGGPQENLCVDVYLPTSAGMHPALLCLHGGAWLRGSQKQYKSGDPGWPKKATPSLPWITASRVKSAQLGRVCGKMSAGRWIG